MFEKQLQFLQLSGHLSFINMLVIIFFCSIGTGLGAIGSYLCVRQINDGWAAKSL
jgi:cell division transport system permease protein